MPLTVYDPRLTAINVAGNVNVCIVPAVASATLAAVTAIEYAAGTEIQAAIREFAPSGSVATGTEQFLSDSETFETSGATTWSIDPIVIQYGDPQTTNTLLDGLTVGSVKYIVQRLGKAQSTAVAALDKVRVFQVRVRLVEDVPTAANGDGKKFEARIHLAVLKVNRAAAIS